MKSFRQLSFAAVLTLVLSISAMAGDVSTPGRNGEVGTPGIAGDIQTPTVTGEIGCPGIAGDVGSYRIAGDVSTPGFVSLLLSWMGF